MQNWWLDWLYDVNRFLFPCQDHIIIVGFPGSLVPHLIDDVCVDALAACEFLPVNHASRKTFRVVKKALCCLCDSSSKFPIHSFFVMAEQDTIAFHILWAPSSHDVKSLFSCLYGAELRIYLCGHGLPDGQFMLRDCSLSKRDLLTDIDLSHSLETPQLFSIVAFPRSLFNQILLKSRSSGIL